LSIHAAYSHQIRFKPANLGDKTCNKWKHPKDGDSPQSLLSNPSPRIAFLIKEGFMTSGEFPQNVIFLVVV
jgi:hypothetical protein